MFSKFDEKKIKYFINNYKEFDRKKVVFDGDTASSVIVNSLENMFKKQKDFYEKFYLDQKIINKVEDLKQTLRLKVINEFILKYKNLNRKILVVGCGAGKDASIFKKKVFMLDLAFNAVKITKEKFPKNIYLVADATHLPFKDKSFDCVVCSEVIEHIPDSQKAINEFHRVLRSRGELIITTPNWISWYGVARKIAEFILRRPITSANQPFDNWYTFKTLQKQLRLNFRIVEVRGVWYYPPTGKGCFRLPDFLIFPIFKLFQPLDYFLGKTFPSFGSHIIAVRCIKKEF